MASYWLQGWVSIPHRRWLTATRPYHLTTLEYWWSHAVLPRAPRLCKSQVQPSAGPLNWCPALVSIQPSSLFRGAQSPDLLTGRERLFGSLYCHPYGLGSAIVPTPISRRTVHPSPTGADRESRTPATALATQETAVILCPRIGG